MNPPSVNQPPSSNPSNDALFLFFNRLGESTSPENFQLLFQIFFRETTGMENWLGLPAENQGTHFCFYENTPKGKKSLFPEFEASTAFLKNLAPRKILPAPKSLSPATRLLPVYSRETLLAILIWVEPATAASSEHHDCTLKLAAIAGMALRQFHTQQDLKNHKEELERRVFELALLEETTATFITDLDTLSISKKLLLSIMGYLTCTHGAIYLRSGEEREQFTLVVETTHPEKKCAPCLYIPDPFFLNGSPFHIRLEDPLPASLTPLREMGMDLFFPMVTGGSFIMGFVVVGSRIQGDCPRKKELMLAETIIRQALAPLRNASLYADLKANNEALGHSLDLLKKEITEREKTEERLLEYQGVVAASQDPVALIDEDFRIVLVNRACAEAFGTVPEKLQNKNISRVTESTLFTRKFQDPLQRCLDGETVRFRFSWNFPRWGLRHIDVAGYPYQGLHLGKRAAIVILRDITQMQEMENRLLQSQKMEAIGTLAGGIAHDFNNILSAILGYTELALTRLEEGHRAKPLMENAITACARAADLVRQILSFSRSETHIPEMQSLCLITTTQEALTFLRASLPSTLEILFTHDPSPLDVGGNPTQIHQVITNLCTNAAYAMGNVGTLRIDLRKREIDLAMNAADPELKPGSYAVLMVKDTGTGMSEACIRRIFEPFFTTKPQGKGTGMGLSISHGIVVQHGGTIRVQSREGEGSTFTVYLPLILKNQNPKNIPYNPERLHGTERILFVDDEPDILRLAEATLSDLGYVLTCLSRPEEALRIFREDPKAFDLVILDQVMPRMTGSLLARHLLKTRPDLPILLCSGFSEAISPDMVQDMGIQHYLMKPFSQHHLARTVRRMLDG